MRVHHRSGRLGWGLYWGIAALAAGALPAAAVVPGLAGPLQALAQLIPQLVTLCVAGAGALLGSPWLRGIAARAAAAARTRAGAVVLVVALGAGAAVNMLHSARAARPATRAGKAGGLPAASNAWTSFRGGPQRTGAADPQSGPTHPTVRWSHTDPEANWSSSPAVVDNRLYCGSTVAGWLESTGAVTCLDMAGGGALWSFPTRHPVFSSPSVAEGRVYVGEGLHHDRDCSLYCLDAATGAKVWAVKTRSHVESSPALVDGRVYFGAGADGVYCVEAATGRVLWHREGFHVDLSPAISEGRVFVGTGYGRLAALALDAATGATLWERPSDLPVWGSPALANGQVLWGRGNGDFGHSDSHPRGDVWCLDVATGAQAWCCTFPDAVLTAVALTGSRAVVGCRDGSLYGIDLATGQRAWAAPAGAPVLGSPATDGQYVYATDSHGQALCVRADTGERVWNLALKPWIGEERSLYGSPLLTHGRLCLGASRGQLLCLGDQPAGGLAPAERK